MTDKKDAIKLFLDEQHQKTPKYIIAEIEKSTDLYMLRDYTYSNYDDEICKAANNRIETVMDTVLAAIDDLNELSKLYHDGYYWLRSNDTWKIVTRAKQLYAKMTSIEEVRSCLDAERSKSTDCTAALIWAPQERILELIADDDRRTSFAFLLTTWWCLSQGREYRNQLAVKFMPDALKTEMDLSQLIGWYEPSRGMTTFNLWNHNDNDASRAVRSRILEVVAERVPLAKKYKELNWYRGIVSRYTKDKELLVKIDSRLSEIAATRLEKSKRLSQVLAYLNTMYSVRSCNEYPLTKAHFAQKIDAFVSVILEQVKSAAEVYPLIEQLANHYYSKPNPVLDKFNELIPAYFEQHRDLALALTWYKKHPTGALKNAIIVLIGQETDVDKLMLVPENNTVLLPLAQERFKVLLSSLSEVTDWFSTCIEKRVFFGNKDLFLTKATEFSAAA